MKLKTHLLILNLNNLKIDFFIPNVYFFTKKINSFLLFYHEFHQLYKTTI